MAIGAVVSVCFHRYGELLIARGETDAGVGLGLGIMLFLVSLPWSVPMWMLGGIIFSIPGANEPTFIKPFLFAMPIVAGGAWGAVTSMGAAKWRSRRAGRNCD